MFQNMQIEQKAIEILKTIYDPEIPVNVYDLGLVYEMKVDEEGILFIKMTLTAPGCPVAETLPIQIKEQLMQIPEVKGVSLKLVWEPAWNMDMMSDEAKLILGYL